MCLQVCLSLSTLADNIEMDLKILGDKDQGKDDGTTFTKSAIKSNLKSIPRNLRSVSRKLFLGSSNQDYDCVPSDGGQTRLIL
jgi:hypothetical protein